MGNKGLVIGDRRSTLTRPSVGSKSPARYVKVGYYIDVSTSRCCPRPASQLTGFLVFPANTRKSRRICPLDLVLFCRGSWVVRIFVHVVRALPHDDVQLISLFERLSPLDKYLTCYGHPKLNWHAFALLRLPLLVLSRRIIASHVRCTCVCAVRSFEGTTFGKRKFHLSKLFQIVTDFRVTDAREKGSGRWYARSNNRSTSGIVPMNERIDSRSFQPVPKGGREKKRRSSKRQAFPYNSRVPLSRYKSNFSHVKSKRSA